MVGFYLKCCERWSIGPNATPQARRMAVRGSKGPNDSAVLVDYLLLLESVETQALNGAAVVELWTETCLEL
jgi:hypothetical protein